MTSPSDQAADAKAILTRILEDSKAGVKQDEHPARIANWMATVAMLQLESSLRIEAALGELSTRLDNVEFSIRNLRHD